MLLAVTNHLNRFVVVGIRRLAAALHRTLKLAHGTVIHVRARRNLHFGNCSVLSRIFIVIGTNALLLYELFFSGDSIVLLLGVLIFCNVIYLPMLIRNYVVIDELNLVLYFGLFKDSMAIENIEEIHGSHNPIASSAASLDRLVIKGKRQEMVIALKDKAGFVREMQKRNYRIQVNHVAGISR